MKTHLFKTNINCMGCVATVKPYLDNIQNIYDWKVDITNTNKILEVTTEKSEDILDNIIKAVQNAGFKIELK